MRSTTLFVVAFVVTAERVAAQNKTNINTDNETNTTPTGIPVCVLICARQAASETCCDEGYVRFLLVPWHPLPLSGLTVLTALTQHWHQLFCASGNFCSPVEECITSSF